MSDNIVHLFGGTYVWMDIPTKGRCLVPYKAKLEAKDITVGRKFFSTGGQTWTFIQVWDPAVLAKKYGQVQFWTIIGVRYQTYSDVACRTREELVRILTNEDAPETIAFDRWAE